MKWKLKRLICGIIGHKFTKWDKFQDTDFNARQCSRCYVYEIQLTDKYIKEAINTLKKSDRQYENNKI